MMINGSGAVCALDHNHGGLGAFLKNLRPFSAAIGASCKESWSRVELGGGRHFILVTGVSAPQDQTSSSFASQRRAASVFSLK